MDSVRISVRFPPAVHERLMDHKEVTGVNTNAFVIQACHEKLIREGHPGRIPSRRRKPARSA